MQRFLVLFFGSWLATATFAFANDEVAATPTPTPAASPSTTLTEDLSQFKTAQSLFDHYIKIQRTLSHESAKRHLSVKEAYQHMVPFAERYVAEFEKRFPHDPLRWDMKFQKYGAVWEAATFGYSNEASFSNSLLAKETPLLQEIIDAPDADIVLKQSAFYFMLRNKGDDIENAEDYQKWAQWVSSECDKYPNLAKSDYWQIEELRAQYYRSFDKRKALAICDEILANEDSRSDIAARDNAEVLGKLLKEEIDAEKRAKVIVDEYKKQPLEIQATAVDGSEVDLAKLRGKVVLIDFWGTHCGPCLMAMPELAKTYAAWHDKGFEIVGIGGASNQAELAKMIKARKIAGTQVFDAGGKFSKQCGIFTGIPRVWILNKQGLVVSDELGYDEEKDDSAHLIPRIEKLLAE